MNANEMITKFPGIVLWGRQMHSFNYYIENQCSEALKDNAPKDALYKNDDGKWICVSDLAADHPFRADYADFIS